MPIEKSETGLTQDQYDDLKAAQTGATYRITLQRINYVFTEAHSTSRTAVWDTAYSENNSSIGRCYVTGGVLYFESYISSWTAHNPTAIAAANDVTPSIVADDSGNVRIFYARAGGLFYVDSADDGDTWGAETSLTTLTWTAQIAATSSTVLHVVTYDGHNSRFYRYDLDGSWTATESNLIYPAALTGFDAEAIGGIDILAFTAIGPVRYDSCRQGLWAVRQSNGRWSDPIEVDVLDEYEEGVNERLGVKLGQFNGLLWATYVASDYDYTSLCYSTTGDGKFWEYRQPISSLSWLGKLELLGDNVYLLDDDKTFSSASTVLSGNSTVELDITARVATYRYSREVMHQSTLALHNDDGGLDAYMSGYDRYQVKEELGYWVDGSQLLQQVALTEVDSIGHLEDLPRDMLSISCRDRLAWMADRTEADHYQMWESQLRHWDTFYNDRDPLDDTKLMPFTGLRNTAAQTGSWSTEDNELKLKSNNKEGLALCVIEKFLAHTIDQQAFQVPTDGNDEWAGVVFRALDKDNQWLAYYDQTDDKVKLRQKIEGVWQTAVAETGALSWSVATWYWLRVEARLSQFLCYYSTDGLSWTLGPSYVDVSDTSLRSHYKEGYVGHAGYGFSDEDIEPAEPDPYIPPTPLVTYDLTVYDQLILGSRTAGVAFCETVDYLAAAPTWQLMNNGLDVPGAHYIHALKIQQVSTANRWVYAATNCGIYRCQLPAAASTIWEYRLPTADIQVACGTTGICHVQDIIWDWSTPGHAWAKVLTGTWSPYYHHVIETWDSFATCSATGANLGVGNGLEGNLAIDRRNPSTIIAHGLDGGGGGALRKSGNGGVTWDTVDTTQSWQGSKGWWCYANSGQYIWWEKLVTSPVAYSSDGGETWGTAAFDGTEIQNIRANSHDRRSAYLIAYDGVETWNAVTEEFDQFKQIVEMYCQDAQCIQRLSDKITPVYFAVVGGQTNSAESWLASSGALVDRTGNLHDILLPEREGSADDIDCRAINDWEGGEL
jgi:hypothetical protein